MLTSIVLAMVVVQAAPGVQSGVVIPPQAARTAVNIPDDTYQALVRDYQAARQALIADNKASSDLDRWNALATRFSARAMELARRHPGQPTALQALTWIVDRGDDSRASRGARGSWHATMPGMRRSARSAGTCSGRARRPPKCFAG